MQRRPKVRTDGRTWGSNWWGGGCHKSFIWWGNTGQQRPLLCTTRIGLAKTNQSEYKTTILFLFFALINIPQYTCTYILMNQFIFFYLYIYVDFFIKEIEEQIKDLTTEIETLKLKKQPFSVFQIINDEKKVPVFF